MAETIRIGDRVRLKGAATPKVGTYVRDALTLGFGRKPVVRYDDGSEVFVMDEERWEVVAVSTAEPPAEPSAGGDRLGTPGA